MKSIGRLLVSFDLGFSFVFSFVLFSSLVFFFFSFECEDRGLFLNSELRDYLLFFVLHRGFLADLQEEYLVGWWAGYLVEWLVG